MEKARLESLTHIEAVARKQLGMVSSSAENVTLVFPETTPRLASREARLEGAKETP